MDWYLNGKCFDLKVEVKGEKYSPAIFVVCILAGCEMGQHPEHQ
jgi:hypothetical protein